MSRVFLVIVVPLVALSCARRERPEPATAVGHYSWEIILDRFGPPDRALGVRLMRVDRDGTAVIHVAHTGELLSAAPGRPFLGRYESRGGLRSRTFGEKGLSLVRSDAAAQTAVLVGRGAEEITIN